MDPLDYFIYHNIFESGDNDDSKDYDIFHENDEKDSKDSDDRGW